MQGGYKAATVGGAGAKSAPRANNTVASNGSTNNINSNTNGSNANKKTNAKKKPATNDKGKTVNGSDANDNGAARAAPPPPGFAAAVKGLLSTSAPAPAPSAPVVAPAGFSDSQQRLLRHRALFAFRFLVGKAVDVALVDGSRFVGILDCIDPDDFSLVLKNTQRKDSTHESEPFDSGSTMIFKRRQIAHIAADGVVNYTEGPAVAAAAVAAANAPGFRTDTEISGRSHEHLYGRELESATSWLDPQLDSGELEDTAARRRMSGKGAWNQFEVNEKLFGVVSSYDENLYTTKLDKTKISNEKSREAERLAREIERETTGNFHLQEERGQAVQGDDDLDEEAKYSSVDRKQQQSAQAARNPNAYVPPALRSTSRPSSASAAPNKAVSSKAPTPAPSPTVAAVPTATAATAATAAGVVDVPVVATAAAATASALAASPPSGPAVASTAAASLPRKPISFSEAVTGRPAARPSPTLTSAGAPTAAAASKATPAKPDSKSTTASPKKQPSPKSGKPHAGKAVSPSATKKDTKTEKKASQSTEEKPVDTKSVEDNKADKKSQPAKTSETAVAAATTGSEKKTLNPNAREFKLSAKAVEFKPTFATPPMAPAVVSSPYRQPNGGHYGHMHHPLPPHPVAMGYAPSPEEWMYDANMMLDETEYAQAAAAHAYMGYAMPMMPNAAMMQQPPMYAPMMPPHQQPDVRMGRGGGGYGGGYGHAQPGMYNNQRGGGYYGQGGSVPGAMPYHPAAASGGVPGGPGVTGAPQPPLPREPSPADAEASSLEGAPVSNSSTTSG